MKSKKLIFFNVFMLKYTLSYFNLDKNTKNLKDKFIFLVYFLIVR